jgi:hypothetical protein
MGESMDIRIVVAALFAAMPGATFAEDPSAVATTTVVSAPAAAPAIPPAVAPSAPAVAMSPAPPTVAPPARAEEPPRWTIGAGLGVGGLTILGPSFPGYATGLLSAVVGPIATFFVERRVGEKTWLVFGGAVSASRSDTELPAPTGGAPSSGLTAEESEDGSLSIGLRRVVTRPGALVDVSLQATVEGGTSHARQELTTLWAGSPPVRSAIRYEGRYAAVTGGIAVERELTGGLAVRISTPILGASWSRDEQRTDLGTGVTRSMGAFVSLSPRLELRLAF